MAAGRVHVIGLGPGGPDLVTAGTIEIIAAVPRRYLRTDWHPAASVVPGSTTFDRLYESSDSFEEVYRAIVEELVGAATEFGEVLYGVPGSPIVAEHTVELLLDDDRVQVVVHPALSFLDLTWARLGVDPVETGARLVDGHRFATEAAGERGPLLVAQCNNRFVLSDIKLSVDDGPRVTVLQRLGMPDEAIFEVDWDDLDRVVEPDHLTSLWIPELAAPVGGSVARLDELMRRLRIDDAWKAEQTHDSLKRFLLEESYEVFEAIDDYDPDTGEGAEELCSELGDLLYQVVFHSAIAGEAGWFTFADVADSIHDKLVRRHAHVFDGSPSPSVDELVVGWETDKRSELGRASIMDGIPTSLPALARALKVVKKGDTLDFPTGPPTPPNAEPVRAETDADMTAGSLGEALLTLVELAHQHGLDPEDALRQATDRRVAEVRQHEAGSSGT